MGNKLLKPDNARLTILWTHGKKKVIKKKDEFDLKVPVFPDKPPEEIEIKLVINPDSIDRVILFGEPVSLTDREYNFLKCLAENPGVVVSGMYIYNELYTEYGQVSEYELCAIKYRIVTKLQKQFGMKKIPTSFILTKPREGFILNLQPWEVEIK
jgi:DNA-binding response OmpR family regulator